MQKEWKVGLRVASVNVNSKGTLLRLLASWSLTDEYDVILVQEHHENIKEKLKDLHRQVEKWGWLSTWTPAITKNEGTTWGCGILWKWGLPMVAPVLQEGVARAGGRTCVAQLAWPGLKLIEFLSVYLETGGKINENNLQILSDIA